MCTGTDKTGITKQKFAGHWHGLIVDGFDKSQFAPAKLCGDYDKVFKDDKNGIVALKRFHFSGRDLQVVVKRPFRDFGLRDFFRSIGPSKALRNFRTALKLKQNGIDTAEPVAALWRKRFLRNTESIFVAEYIENSMSLYDIGFGKDSFALNNWPSVKMQIIYGVAQLLSNLHNCGFWHRDSKAGNFLVFKDVSGIYKVKLIDLDGIKQYRLFRKRRRRQSLWKLAETLSRFEIVSTVDLWRGFKVYCEKTGVERDMRRRLFKSLQKKTIAKRLLTITADAYKKI